MLGIYYRLHTRQATPQKQCALLIRNVDFQVMIFKN